MRDGTLPLPLISLPVSYKYLPVGYTTYRKSVESDRFFISSCSFQSVALVYRVPDFSVRLPIALCHSALFG